MCFSDFGLNLMTCKSVGGNSENNNNLSGYFDLQSIHVWADRVFVGTRTLDQAGRLTLE
jgi:hypothetical protein